MYNAGMSKNIPPGLGELLRQLSEEIDKGSEARYSAAALAMRPRYTPLLRRLAAGHNTVKALTSAMGITQGAVSQTLKRLEAEGLIQKQPGPIDKREQIIHLTDAGQKLVATLDHHWRCRLQAIDTLETEIGAPLRDILRDVLCKLAGKSFEERIKDEEDALKKSLKESQPQVKAFKASKVRAQNEGRFKKDQRSKISGGRHNV